MYRDSAFHSVHTVPPPLACSCHGLYWNVPNGLWICLQLSLFRHCKGRCGGFDGYVYSEIFRSYLRLELRQENYVRQQKVLRHVQHDCWRIEGDRLISINWCFPIYKTTKYQSPHLCNPTIFHSPAKHKTHTNLETKPYFKITASPLAFF